MLFVQRRAKCWGCGKRTQRKLNMGGYYGAIGAHYFYCRACSVKSATEASI